MSSITPFQPTLPLEDNVTDAEIAFIEDSPHGLFPENQDSNFGYIIRKLFSDRVQELINQQQTLYSEMFVASSSLFLDEWEREVGLPVAPTSMSITQRRQVVLSRLRQGPFTRTRRADVVRAFVQATIGDAIALTPSGVALVSAGVQIFSGLTSLAGAFTITENIPGFSYTITVATGVTLDQIGLTRELKRITPAGISFTVVTSSNVFKAASDSGFGADSGSRSGTSPISTDSGSASEFAFKGTASSSDSGVGTDFAGFGYGMGNYGQGKYGGVPKVTGIARITMSTISTPSTREQIKLRVRARKANAGDSGVLIVSLYSAGVLIEGPYQITLTNAFTTYEHVVLNAANISSFSTLEVRLEGAVDTTTGNLTAQVSQIELETKV